MRMHGLASIILVTCVTACGSSGSSGPDAAYSNMCGPVKSDAGNPNTLEEHIRFDATLTKACSPYYVDKPVLVTKTLTIEPGVEIIACQGGCRTRITFADQGKLMAQGTAEEPITFTSVYRDSGGTIGGQWTGILFLEAPGGSILDHVIIEFAGGPYIGQPSDDEFTRYEFPVEGSLLNDSTPDLTVSNVWIRRSRGYAIATTTSQEFEQSAQNIYAIFDVLTLTDNALGVWVPVDQAGTLGPDLCFAERDAMGVCPAGSGGPATNYVEVHVDDELGRTPESIKRTALWKPYQVPYKVENIAIMGGATLTIADGVDIRMTDLGGVYVGTNEPGALVAVAQNPGGIKIGSFYDPPMPDEYWKGLYIWNMAIPGETRIENVDLQFGGRETPQETAVPPAMISVFGTNPVLNGNYVANSLGAGIHWDCTATPSGVMGVPGGPDDPGTNTSDDGTIACAAMIGAGIAQNYGCDCPGGGCQARCPQPNP